MNRQKPTVSNSRKGKKKVVFGYRGEPGCQVCVAGSFNDWSPTAKPLVDKDGSGEYQAVAMLPRGRHEYKFVIDGVWRVDPQCADWAPNDCGSINSVLIVE